MTGRFIYLKKQHGDNHGDDPFNILVITDHLHEDDDGDDIPKQHACDHLQDDGGEDPPS